MSLRSDWYPLTKGWRRCECVGIPDKCDRDSNQFFGSKLTTLCTQVVLRQISVEFVTGQIYLNRFKWRPIYMFKERYVLNDLLFLKTKYTTRKFVRPENLLFVICYTTIFTKWQPIKELLSISSGRNFSIQLFFYFTN